MVQLNVGGHLFSTTLSTLRKSPDSRLAEMFGGQPNKVRPDAQGRFFIDRDGSHFGPVLEFLRSERLPTENVQEVGARSDRCVRSFNPRLTVCVCGGGQVYKEAVHYNIKPLIKRLEEAPQMFGELVGRQQFLSRVPHYKENIEVSLTHSGGRSKRGGASYT